MFCKICFPSASFVTLYLYDIFNDIYLFVFFIFVVGGVFGILNRSGAIVAGIHHLLGKYRDSGPLLTILLMAVIAVGGSTLGMGEEFIPLVPLFLIVSKELGYDRIFGMALVFVAAETGFMAATPA